MFTVTMSDDSLLPTETECLAIELRRDPDTCAARSIVIRDLDDSKKPVWIASRAASAPAGVAALSVTPVAATACAGFDQFALKFGWSGATTTVSQAELGTLTTDVGDWKIRNYASRESALGDSFAWVMKR